MSAKAKRQENFSLDDRILLFEYITPFAEILESKTTDTFSNRKKQKAWEDILGKFNSRSSCKRSILQLKGS